MPDALEPSELSLRPATPDDAPAIGAVFDAAVRAGWTYLGKLAEEPMFGADDWDRLVADHDLALVIEGARDRRASVERFIRGRVLATE